MKFENRNTLSAKLIFRKTVQLSLVSFCRKDLNDMMNVVLPSGVNMGAKIHFLIFFLLK